MEDFPVAIPRSLNGALFIIGLLKVQYCRLWRHLYKEAGTHQKKLTPKLTCGFFWSPNRFVLTKFEYVVVYFSSRCWLLFAIFFPQIVHMVRIGIYGRMPASCWFAACSTFFFFIYLLPPPFFLPCYNCSKVTLISICIGRHIKREVLNFV